MSIFKKRTSKCGPLKGRFERHSPKVNADIRSRWNQRIRLDVDASGRIVRRQPEVLDRHPRKTVERLERDILDQLHAVEDRAERSNTQRVRRDRPRELLIVEQERRKLGELVVVSDLQSGAGLVVRDAVVGSGADWNDDLVTMYLWI